MNVAEAVSRAEGYVEPTYRSVGWYVAPFGLALSFKTAMTSVMNPGGLTGWVREGQRYFAYMTVWQ